MSRYLHWLKYFIRIFSLLILIAITALFFDFFNRELDNRMQQLKDNMARYLEEQLQYKIAYKNISPSIFNYLEIRDLLIYEDQSVRVFQIKRVRIVYNIFKLLSEEDPLQAVSAIEIANTQFEADLTPSPDEKDPAVTAPQTTFFRKLLRAPYHFTLKGKNVELLLRMNGTDVMLSGLFFSLRDNAGDFSLNINKGSLAVSTDGLFGDRFRLTAGFKLYGSVSDDFNYADLLLNIQDLSSSYARMGKQTLQIIYAERKIEVRKIQDKAAIDLQVVYDMASGLITTNFKTEDFRPDKMITLAGPLSQYRKWLNTNLSCTGNIAFTPGMRDLRYDITAHAFLNKAVLPVELEVDSTFNGDLKKINFDCLHVITNLGSLDFIGNMLFENYFPEGFVELVNVRAVPGREINAAFDIIRNTSGLSLRGTSLLLGSSGFDLFDADIYPLKDSINFNLTTSLTGVARDDLVTAAGTVLLGTQPQMSITGSLKDTPVNAFYKLFSAREDFSGELYTNLAPYLVTSDFTLQTDFKNFSLASRGFQVEDLQEPGNFLYCSLDASHDSLRLTNLHTRWAGYEFTGILSGKLEENGTVFFSSSLAFEGLSYSFQGIYSPAKRFLIRGSYGLILDVYFAANQDLVFRIVTNKIPIPVQLENKNYLEVSMEANGVYTAEGKLQLASPGVIFHDVPLLAVEQNELKFACTMDNDGMELKNFIYSDAVSTVLGTGKIVFSKDKLFSGSGSLSLNHQTTNETYKIEMTLTGNQVDALIHYNSGPVERLGDLIITGAASGIARLKGDFQHPDLYVNFQLEKGKINSDSVTMNGEIDFSSQGIGIHAFNFGFLEHRLLNCTGKMDFTDGSFAINSDYKYLFFKNNISSVLQITGAVKDVDRIKYLDSIWYNDFTASILFGKLLVDEKKFSPWACHFIRKEDAITLSGGPDNAYHALINLDGTFHLEITEPFPIRTVADGTLFGKKIQVNVREIWIDLKIFALMLDPKILAFQQGYGVGQNIVIAGSLNDPDYTGNIRVNDAVLAFFMVPEATQPFDANLLFEEKIIRLTNARAQIGAGAILANGLFEIDHWFPMNFDLNIISDTKVGVHVAHTFHPLVVDGYATGQVRTRGNEFDIYVEGSLKAPGCDLQMTDEVPVVVEDEDAANLHVNLNFTAGGNVEFHLPSVTFPLINCYAKQGSQIFLSFESAINDFSLKGTVEIQGGEVIYFDRNFFLKSGELKFNETEDTFDPRLTVEAQIKEIDEKGESFTIYLVVDDKKLSEFEPYFRSVPSRSQDEIIAILGGSISEKFSAGGIQGLAILSGDLLGQLGQIYIFRSMEKSVREALNLDLFSIRMPILKNILQDQLGGDSGIPGNSLNPLGRYFDNTTVTLGQYWGTDLFFSGLVRLRDAEFLVSEDFFTPNFLGLVPELEFSLEWLTPYFNLEYVFTPKIEHLNDFFLQDNALKFEWSYSY